MVCYFHFYFISFDYLVVEEFLCILFIILFYRDFFSPSSVGFKFGFIKKVYPKGSKSIIYDAHGVWETLGYYDL